MKEMTPDAIPPVFTDNNNRPILSIVTPTRGNFTDHWLNHLYAVTGNVEFVLVYPPGVTNKSVADSRFKLIVSPFKGEVIQRFTGLLNASGLYVLALDDDDFVHPEVLQIVTQYFEKFPDSWCLRLMKKNLNFQDTEQIYKPWEPIPDISQLKIASRQDETNSILQEIPIAPLNNNFDTRFIVGPYVKRKDMHGPHIENFNNKVWKTELVKSTLIDLGNTMIIHNALTWIPRWNLDRMLGLFIQAKFFEEDKIVGHWMPMPEQIRYVYMSQGLKNDFRLMLPADALLAKQFPKYGYFWNLFFEQFWIALKKMGRSWIKLNK